MSTESDTIQMQAALTANKLASAAIALAIAAILLGYVQLLLGSDMTSNALWKTNRAAIGVMEKHRRIIPSWRRVKVLYPRISLKVEDLAYAAYLSAPDYRAPKFLRRFAKDQGFSWETAESPEAQTVHLPGAAKLNQLWNPIINKPVLVDALPLFTRLQYRVWHRFTYQERPRATWAQILEAFSISDGLPLIKGQLDSSSIPATIDVPIQRVLLTELADLALILGCSSVELDVESRTFSAVGPHCIFTTEDIPTFGKAVRFEGDVDALVVYTFDENSIPNFRLAKLLSIAQSIRFALPQGLAEEARLLIFGSALPGDIPMINDHLKAMEAPLDIIRCFHVDEGVLPDDVHMQTELCAFGASPPLERDPSQDPPTTRLSTMPNEAMFARWQHARNRSVPTVLLMGAIRELPGTFMGFPSGTYLRDLVTWCAIESRLLVEINQTLCPQRKIFRQQRDCTFQERARLIGYLVWDESVRFGEKPEYTWCSWKTKHISHELPEDDRPLFRSLDLDESCKFLGAAVISSQVVTLMEDFAPHSWVSKAKPRTESLFFGFGELQQFNPLAILWKQIVLLDVSIHLQVRHGGQIVGQAAGSDPKSFIQRCRKTVEAIAASRELKPRKNEASVRTTDPGSVGNDQKTMQPGIQSPERTGDYKHVHEETTAAAAQGLPSNSLSEDLAPGPPLETTTAVRCPSDGGTSGQAGEEDHPTADSAKQASSTSPTTERLKEMVPGSSGSATSTGHPGPATTAVDPTPNNPGSTSKPSRLQQPSAPVYQPWDLEGALIEKGVYEHLSPEIAAHACKRLAVLLKLRSILFITLLILGPDTSQVAAAHGSEAMVPMV